MAAKKKVNPRTQYITCRVSKSEEITLHEKAVQAGFSKKKEFSIYIRSLLGLKEENE